MTTYYVNKRLSQEEYLKLKSIINHHGFKVRRMSQKEQLQYGEGKQAYAYWNSWNDKKMGFIPRDIYQCNQAMWKQAEDIVRKFW